MSIVVWSILVTVVSQVAYHLAQKSVPSTVAPFGVLTVVYVIAAALCVVCAPLTGKPLAPEDLRQALGWPTYLLALSVVGIEIGFLLAYRSGWTLGTTFALASTAAVVLLAVIGARWLGEALSVRHIIGLALALAGSWLLLGGA